jgi:cellulose synthase/poly-beta-1,6-N-acetylglucosamine synthase-like glycosyltransferase
VPVVQLTPDDEQVRADHALHWLADQAPDLSGETLFSRGQQLVGIGVLVLLFVGFVLSPLDTGIILIAVATIVYLCILVNRVTLTVGSLRDPRVITVTDDEARDVDDADLPVYTVLVPMYHEAAVVPQLVTNLRSLDYPADRLDVKLLVEQDDRETIDAVTAYAADAFEIVVVPDGIPRTKPRALNYGLTLARGSFVTIYDAEDRPDPLQLRKAAVAFSRTPPEVGCLQARLDYWNSDQNLITRWFGTEYLQWFRLLLPGLSARDAPIPLGGTSNHIRRELLDAVGAWDPHNVTEDADLGIRLHRAGYRCAVLDSVTWEEANSDYVNWNNQRSRWYKGYLQTWLVHMRHPLVLLDELGWKGWLECNAFVGGTPVLSLLNLVFWGLTVAWFVGHVSFIEELFPTLIYYPALLCLVVGNVTVIYLYVISARISNRPTLVWSAVLVPIYWLMMGIAALKACWQLLITPSYWEKTVHGLAGDHGDGGGTVAAVPSGGDVVGTAAAPFETGGPPPLAVAVSSRSGHGVQPFRWPSAVGTALQAVGVALLVFVLYVAVLSGATSAQATPEGFVGGPLPARPVAGTTVARVQIVGPGIDLLVVEGTAATELNRDVGHVPGTPLPGTLGDSVLVGHRVAYGGPLRHLPQVLVGDEVDVTVGGGRARYAVVSVGTQGGRTVALPTAYAGTLTVVTSDGGLGSDGLLVVRAKLVATSGVRIAGPAGPGAGAVAVAGVDRSSALAALGWLVGGVAAVLLARYARRRSASLWATSVFAVAALIALFEWCIVGGHALPITF